VSSDLQLVRFAMQSLDWVLIDLSYQTHRELMYRPLQFHEHSYLLIWVHNEAVSRNMVHI